MKTNTYLFEKVPVPKAVATMAVPTMISMLVVVIYNMADTFFIGQTQNCPLLRCCIFSNTGIYDFYGTWKPVWHRWKFGYFQGTGRKA